LSNAYALVDVDMRFDSGWRRADVAAEFRARNPDVPTGFY
jgi:hypothetical protein